MSGIPDWKSRILGAVIETTPNELANNFKAMFGDHYGIDCATLDPITLDLNDAQYERMWSVDLYRRPYDPAKDRLVSEESGDDVDDEDFENMSAIETSRDGDNLYTTRRLQEMLKDWFELNEPRLYDPRYSSIKPDLQMIAEVEKTILKTLEDYAFCGISMSKSVPTLEELKVNLENIRNQALAPYTSLERKIP